MDLIDFDDFGTQKAQHRKMTRTSFGDYSQTSIVTIDIMVYTDQREQVQTVPNMEKKFSHFAIVGPTWVGTVGDHITDVEDKHGDQILVDSRIVEVRDFNHWDYSRKFRQLVLDVELS